MLANILSVIAIVISVLVAVTEYIKDIKINRLNLESEYFKDIYKKHLIYEIPTARGYIRLDGDNKLIDIDKMINELQLLRQDSLYFQYNNLEFYNNLKDKTQDLEDYLVSNGGRQFIGEEQTQLYNRIQNSINAIYCVISDGYLGKRKKKKNKNKKGV